MIKDIESFHHQLLQWYQQFHRDLPWRRTRDPYKIWVSEIMLQQTQVSTVIPYYTKFIKKFPTVEALSRADLNSVLKIWEGLGYYSRARNLHKAAKTVSDMHGGSVPRSVSGLRKLPGIGDYTAGAILSIAFDDPVPVVDGNVKRVFARLMMLSEPVNKATSDKRYKAVSNELLYRENPGHYNQALMELGALVCKPKEQVQCMDCPVSSHCISYENNVVADYPKVIPKKQVPTYQIAVGVVEKDGKLLITRRQKKGLLGGLWEFPGGKIEEGESAEAACVREILEETNLTVEVKSHLSVVKHAYTHFKIKMEVFLCDYLAGKIKLNGPIDHNWIQIDQIEDYPFPKANHKFIPKLIAAMENRY